MGERVGYANAVFVRKSSAGVAFICRSCCDWESVAVGAINPSA
jgi:hypothetical protein